MQGRPATYHSPSFAELVFRLGHPPKSKRFDQTGNAIPISADKIFSSWINRSDHPRTFPRGTGKRLFRLLFPHDGSRRRYGIKETQLSAELERILGIQGLREWDQVGWEGEGGKGCLGDVLQRAMAKRVGQYSTRSIITLTEVDALLDQLAAPCTFSQLSLQPQGPLSQSAILCKLFRDSGLSPHCLAVMTQVILRDLRPLLLPLPALPICHPTMLLRTKIAQAPQQLKLHRAMHCWDTTMARLYRDGKGSVDWCADAAEAIRASPANTLIPVEPGPVVGMNVQVSLGHSLTQIPKCEKGRSVHHALAAFFDGPMPKCSSVWAETKYDGYRMQIHVRVDGREPEITVYSKSKRRSTVERLNTHS